MLRFAGILLAGLVLAQDPPSPATVAQAARLEALARSTPALLPLRLAPLLIQAPEAGWETDYVSSVAQGTDGVIYALCRNLRQDPVVAIDARGRVLWQWGRGLYTIPFGPKTRSIQNSGRYSLASSIMRQPDVNVPGPVPLSADLPGGLDEPAPVGRH